MSHSHLQRWVILSLIVSAALLLWRGVPRTAPANESPLAAARRVAAPDASRGATPPPPVSGEAGHAGVAPGLDPFTPWAGRYAAATEAQKPALVAEGIRLAQVRAEAMAQLIHNDPKAAVAAILPYRLRKALPPEIATRIEYPVRGTGELQMLAVSPLPGQTVAEPIWRLVKIGGDRYQTYTYGQRLQQISTKVTPILGVAIKPPSGLTLLALREAPYEVLENAEAADLLATVGPANAACPITGTPITGSATALHTGAKVVWLASPAQVGTWLQTPDGQVLMDAGGSGSSGGTSTVTPAGWATGNKKFLAIRVRFANQAANYESVSDAVLNTSLQGTVNTWSDWSYGKLEASYAYTPVLTLAQPDSWYYANGQEDQLRTDALAAAAAYDDGTGNHPYAAPETHFDFQCVVFQGDVSSRAYAGTAAVGGTAMWMKSPESVGVFLHEWGHNFGLGHAGLWNVTTDSPIGAGARVEYGNNHSVMGGNLTGPYSTLERYNLNWLQSTDVVTPTTSGSYRIYNPDKTALTAGHPYGLRVAKDSRIYCVEFRPNWTSAADFTCDNGALVCWTQNGSELLDMTPLTAAGQDDAALLIGRSFNDAAAGITITPTGRGGTYPDDYLDVVVNFTDPAADSQPVAVVTASNYAPAVNSAITLTAVAGDPDGDTLAYAWDFGDGGNQSVNNSATQSKSWNTAGDYNVRCTVSDMKGKTSVQNVVIHVGAPATFTISGRVTQSDGTPVPDVVIQDTNYHLAYTDSDGRYTFGALAVGSYELSAVHEGWTFTAQFTNPVVVGPSVINMDFSAAGGSTTSGGLTAEIWTGIAGGAVSNLTGNAAYPNSPSGTYRLTPLFETPTNAGDNYGQRVRGYFKPPTTGAYAFYIASDDQSELWLSTNESASNKVKIATQTSWTNPREWTKYTNQKSAAITLTAGQRYYIEALHKDSSGGDNLAVGVDFPNGAQHRPIEATYLDPMTTTTPPPTPVNTVTVAATDASASEAGPDTGTFTITRTGPTTAALPLYFDLTGTATYGSDYQPTGLSATIPAGAASTTVTITPLSDALAEPDETVILTLSPAVTYTLGATTSGTVIIHDSGAAQVSIVATDAIASETGGDTGAFTITRTGSTASALSVSFSIGGSATNGTDYPTLTSPVTIPAGQSSATITIAPINDGVLEVDETVVLTVTSGTGYTVGSPATASVRILGQPGNGGGILREWYDFTSYYYQFGAMGDLVGCPRYPFTVTGTAIETGAFETPVINNKDYYGERWRAWFTAPATGNYVFYLASDDASELWLSTDATPERKSRICYATTGTGYRNWTAQASQTSATIALTAGQRYYIEALFKDYTGSDDMSVGVLYPNGALERPIPANRFDPYTPASPLPVTWTATNLGSGPLGSAGVAADFIPAAPKHRYSFSGTANGAIVDGTAVTDSIGGANAAVRGAGAVFNSNGAGIDLPGGSSTTQAYIDLPNGVITGTYGGGTRYTSATYETWVTMNTTQSWARIFDFGTSSSGEVTAAGGSFNGTDTHHVALSSNNGTTPYDQRLSRNYPAGTTDVYSDAHSIDSLGTAANAIQYHVVLVYDAVAQNWRWYRNGLLMQTLPDTQGLTTINDLNNWLGRSMVSTDSNLDGVYDEFRIYDYALTEAQIRGNKNAGANKVNTVSDGTFGPLWVSGSGYLSTASTTDTCHLETQTLTGDFTVQTKLLALTQNTTSAFGGLMIREGTTATARHAFIGLNPSGISRFIKRTTTPANASYVDVTGLVLPQWLRLVRAGNTIAAYISADGTTWTQEGSTTTYASLPASLQVGLAVSGGAATATALAQFDDFKTTSTVVAPTVTVTPTDTATKTAPITFTLTFSEAVTGLTAAEVTVTNGSKGALSGSGSTYTIPVTPSAQGAVTCQVPAAAAQSASSVNNTVSNSATVTYDTVAPSVTVTGSASLFTLTFSEAVSGLTTAGITVANGTKGALSGSGMTYTLAVTPSAQGSVTCQVAAAAAQDVAGNNNTISNNCAAIYDTIAPAVSVTPTGTATNTSPITFTLAFSEAVSGLTAGGVSITNGTKGALSGSGATYTLAVTPTAQGPVTCQVPAAAAQDVASNNNAASSIAMVTYDTVAPSVTVTGSASLFTLTFSEAVSGLTTASITVANGTKGALSGSGMTYTLAVTPSAQGPVTCQVAAAAAQDAAGNNNTISNNFAAIYDTIAPTVSVTPTGTATNTSPITFTLAFSEAVSGLTAGGVTITNGTAGALSGSAATYTLAVTPTTQGPVTCQVPAAAAQDVASNNNTASNIATVTYDTLGPVLTIGAPSVASTLSGPVTYAVTYADPNFNASTLAAGNITLNTTGTATGSMAVTGTGATRTVTISSITGNGTLGISIAAATASDTLGNLASAAGPSTTFLVSSAGPVTKAATGTDLTAGASWTGATAPTATRVAAWASTSLGASLTMATPTTWGGISVTGAKTAIAISGAGALTLDAGGIDLATSTVILAIANPLVLAASQGWNVNAAMTVTASGSISGSGCALTKYGVGTLTLAGANTFDGGLTIKAGTVTATTSTSALGGSGSGAVTLGGIAGQDARLMGNTTTYTLNNPITLSSTGGNLTIGNSANGTLLYGGTVSGTHDLILANTANGPLIFTKIDITGAITYTATGNNAVTITTLGANTGSLTLASTGGAAAGLTITNAVTTSGSLLLTNTSTSGVITLTGGASNTGSITNTGTSTGGTTITGAITSNVTGVTQSNPNSTLKLSNATNAFTGGLYIKAGTVHDNGTVGSLGPVGSTIYLGDTSGNANATWQTGLNATATNNPIVVQAGSSGNTLSIENTGGQNAYLPGNVTLGHDLTLKGYSGTATSRKTLKLTGNITGTGNIILVNNQTLAQTYTQVELSGSSINFSGELINTGTGLAANTTTLSGNLGPLVTGVTQNSSTTLILSGSNTYTGPTTVLAGTLSISSAFLADTSTLTIASGAVMNLNFSGSDTIATLVLGGAIVPAGTYNSAHPTYGAYFTGAGSLIVTSGPSFDNWINTFTSLSLQDRAATSDPDHDGINNLLEYALGGNPTLASLAPWPLPHTTTGKLALTFTRTLSTTDLTLTVQAADSPAGPWTDLASSVNGAAMSALLGGLTVLETGTGTTRSVEVRDLYLTSDSAHTRRFMRLQVRR